MRLQLGAESGLDLLPRLVDLVPGVRAVILTGKRSVAVVEEAMKRGALACLFKPCNVDDLLACFCCNPRNGAT